jgi:DDE superfamily endonuclease
MLPGLTLPASWCELLETLRPVFRRSSRLGLFVLLAAGLVARSTRRTVVGMLAGAGMAALVSFQSACRFFSDHVWDVDRLGLAVARLIVDRLLGADAPITVAVDDTLFRRWGRRVQHAFWTHDGSAQGPAKLGRGNRWVIVGIVVGLPFCSPPVCLPVLFRLWAGKGAASPVQLAGAMLTVLAEAFPDKDIHAVGDAAYHGEPLLVAGTTITTRLPANTALHQLAPPPTGRRGRPAKKGERLPRLADLAATATWRTARVDRYGRVDTVMVAALDCLWYGAFGATPGQLVLVREPATPTGYDLALFTTDRTGDGERIVERYAQRWSIEPANATGKQLLGVGQARNRVAKAVERTVPFGFLIQTLVTVWYTLFGYHPDDLTSRHAAEPWYDHKTEPASLENRGDQKLVSGCLLVLGGVGVGLEGDVVSEGLQLFDGHGLGFSGVVSGVVVGAWVLVEGAVDQHLPGVGEHLVLDGYHGDLAGQGLATSLVRAGWGWPAAAGDAPVAGPVVGVGTA